MNVRYVKNLGRCMQEARGGDEFSQEVKFKQVWYPLKEGCCGDRARLDQTRQRERKQKRP